MRQTGQSNASENSVLVNFLLMNVKGLTAMAVQLKATQSLAAADATTTNQDTEMEGTGVFNRHTRIYPLSNLDAEEVKRRVNSFSRNKSQ
ncbi:hypothetical protein SARC_05481 [Sphaeroforma arctica JP610]|uniref:Uncharacterized protein n=1 Tax=Sphaeroforma arctica JP610 TaxID=667725 RepID=A0A0L0G1Z2_9EUKA|nr:hypothetical protein SARC_05481 [Sphaeroforma arctica JP610]KNC82213.1 hypothetical protein SARC_05481 [Sphaeroforma arctica JP610]|eukprot:XP_014156115.1 hypothetical protein SARC_05481 [Sphaeroforma arctica JP610]